MYQFLRFISEMGKTMKIQQGNRADKEKSNFAGIAELAGSIKGTEKPKGQQSSTKSA